MNIFSLEPRSRSLRWFATASVLFALLFFAHTFTAATPQPAPEAAPVAADTLDLSKIYGKIQVVESFPDYKVKIVDSFPDLKVQIVESFPNSEGKWQMVSSFPDYKIQFVESFPDFTIKYVDSFPGVQ